MLSHTTQRDPSDAVSTSAAVEVLDAVAQLDLIPLEARQAWNEALDGIPHSFHHTQDFAYAMHLTTGYPTFLLLVRDGETRLVCPLVEREFAGYVDVATPSGLSGFAGTGRWSRFAPPWNDFVHDRRYVSGYIGLHPLFAPPDLSADAHSHNSIYVLCLDLGLEELLLRMNRNRRRELRGWETRARDFVLDRDALSDFLAVSYEPFLRRLQARSPHLAPQTLDFLCRSDGCLVAGTAPAGRLDGVFVFGATPYAGDCLINVTTGKGRRHTTDLVWYGVDALIEKQVPVLNLGGGARDDDGVAKAKQRFRPERLPLRALRQVYRPDAYAELCALARVDASSEGDYFPAYRAPHVRTVGEAAS